VNARRLRQSAYEAVKIAGKIAVEKLGGVTLAATLTRALQPHLSKAISTNWPDSFMCVDQVLDFEDLLGEPIITRVMADRLGYDLVPREARRTDESLSHLLADVVRQCADVPARGFDLMGARPCEQNRETLRKEIREALESLETLYTSLDEPRLHAVG
jgi:hypothetical protein